MTALSRTLHVLALGLWFGTTAFFTLAGLLIFQAFADESRAPAEKRPLWLPLPAAFERDSPSPRFPNPLRLEQGSRLAGVAVGQIFPWYFGIQTGCALVALLTGLTSGMTQGGLGKARLGILALGVVSVLAGWGIERVVEHLRIPRNSATDNVLQSPAPSAELIHTAEEARGAFGMWHGISLLVNFTTLGLAGAGLALAAHLPPSVRPGGP